MAPPTPDPGTLELIRLANRVTYGANRQVLAAAESLGYEGFIDWQLDYPALDDSELEELLQQFLPTLTMDAATLADFVFEQENFGAPQRDLIIATLIRRAFSPRQLYERVVEFWSDHFSVPATDVIGGFFKALEDRDLIRRHALYDFATLLVADARSPAMLYYLDNFVNTADGPNENYARELLELHTMGVDGGYTEVDIKEIARVFTGWTIRPPAEFVFNPATHDWDAKNVLGQPIPAFGEIEGDRVLGMLAEHPSTARHVSTKLARRFFSDDPGPAVIDAVAEAFTASAGDVRTTLRALLLHPEVVATQAIKFKRPLEFLTATARSLESTLSERSLGLMFSALESSGHVPFAWPAPDGYPDVRSYWQSTNGLLVRFNAAAAWAAQLADQSALLSEAEAIAAPIAQMEFLAATLRPQGMDGASRRVMMRYANRLAESERVSGLAAWLLAGPEAQWR